MFVESLLGLERVGRVDRITEAVGLLLRGKVRFPIAILTLSVAHFHIKGRGNEIRDTSLPKKSHEPCGCSVIRLEVLLLHSDYYRPHRPHRPHSVKWRPSPLNP